MRHPAGRGGELWPRTCRLRFRREFDLVWNRGRKKHAPHFLIVVLDKASGPTRLGLAVGRKVGGAVARNRLKRLIREFFRLHYAMLAPHADMVVVAKPGAAALSHAQLRGELAFILVGRSMPKSRCPEESSSR